MANRQALRELQSRLADRLQAARVQGIAASWLAVEAAGGRYLLPLAQSGEIFPWSVPQPVPYTRAWFLGVANLRGGLYGVVDFASFVTGSAPQPRTEQARTESRLVALNAALGLNCALLIDRLAGLRNAEAFVESRPPGSDDPAFFGSDFADAAGARWREIDLQALSEQPLFLSISE